jgi:histidyl-tRNA synthetase
LRERIQVPKGTFDVLGDDALARDSLAAVARKVLERAGYERIETPVFEATDLFARGVGASTDIVRKEMYSFEDAGGRSLTLRPEGTAPVCRAYMEHGMHKRAQPVKFFYLAPFFRAEAPQAGRFRQFWQLGAEAIGSDDPGVDAELIVLLAELLEEIGAQGIRLRLGSLGTPAARAAYREELLAFISAATSDEQLLARAHENPLRLFDSAPELMRDAPRLLDRLAPEDAEHFAAVRGLLDAVGLAYEIDSTLVRGLDYYTRTVFEFTSDALGAQSGVGGGGRYDGLVEQLGGPPTPGCGWAAGVERMLMCAQQPATASPPVDLYVAGDARLAFRLAADARRFGHAARVELAGRSIKGVFKQADRIGARYVAIVGTDGEVELKDMQTGEQQTVPLVAVIHHITGGIL